MLNKLMYNCVHLHSVWDVHASLFSNYSGQKPEIFRLLTTFHFLLSFPCVVEAM